MVRMGDPTIEDIVLARDVRQMTALRPFLPADYVSEAARFVLERPGTALIVTGFYIPRAGAPETDGPPGAAALGEALGELGYDVKFVTDRFSRLVVEAVVEGRPVVEFPTTSHAESEAFARRLLGAERPSLVMAIERAGLLGDGTYRNYMGVDFTDCNAKTDYLFTLAPASVGIGDGGNEIGMGNLRAVIPCIVGLPQDPCVTTTDRLVVAACSNWGAYGLIAALSVTTGRTLLPSVERGYEWVRRAVDAGAVEGLSAEAKDWVDGRPPQEDAECLRDLHALVARHARATSRGSTEGRSMT
jgi:hypothetical protein